MSVSDTEQQSVEEFVFVCYSHSDSAIVIETINKLRSNGVTTWFDEGIRPGSEWTEELAEAITGCSKFLYFVTDRSAESRHCRNEVRYALNLGKPFIVVYLEPTELPPGLELVLGSIQALHAHDSDPARHYDRLLATIRAKDEIPRSISVSPQSLPQAQKKKLPFLAVATVFITIALTATIFWFNTSTSDDKITVVPAENSMAVLPLEDEGGFEENADYLDSLSEDLLNRLANVDGLDVASRRSSFRFRERRDDLSLPEIADELGVNIILTGYLRKIDDRLRVGIELVDVSSGREVVRWSQTFSDRPLNDLVVIQAEITRAIALELLPGELSNTTESRLAQQSTSSPEAYDYYLQAREILRQPVEPLVSLERAADLLNRALALDNQFAWGWAALCETHLTAYRRGAGFAAAEAACEQLDELSSDLFLVRLAKGNYSSQTGNFEKAEAEITASIAMNPRSADAKISLAKLYAEKSYSSQSPDAQLKTDRAYLDAIGTEPDYWYAYHNYASYLTRAGRFDEALEQLRIAISIKPTSISSINNVGAIQYNLGRWDEAEQTWLGSIEMMPNNRFARSGLGTLYHYLGRFDDAVAQLRVASEISPEAYRLWGKLGESYRMIPGAQENAYEAFSTAVALAETNKEINPNNWRTFGYLGLYYAYLGEFKAAREHIDEMFKLNPGNHGMTYYWSAMVAWELHEVDFTFAQLELALKYGLPDQKRLISQEPALNSLREKHAERFEALIARY